MIPIVGCIPVAPPSGLQKRVDRLAEDLQRYRTDLNPSDRFLPLMPTRIGSEPSLHLDDLSGITETPATTSFTNVQDRARLRAVGGDYVASFYLPFWCYEDYCRNYLGMGDVTWLRPPPSPDSRQLAAACWTVRGVRHDLVSALRKKRLRYLHPYMGSLAVWELGLMLHEASRRPVKVIAPYPGLTRWVNDKGSFTEVVRMLFGREWTPETFVVWNLATLSERVYGLADSGRSLVVKLPDSAGGGGNLVLESAQFRNRSLASIRSDLKKLLGELAWHGERKLLVGSWETDIVGTPSAQLWIPPNQEDPPVLEGVFEQEIVGSVGVFKGSRPASMEEGVYREVGERSWLLARLFQRLGYVGRCSFDLLLVGNDLQDCRIEFIECNGRWGGTSMPMTLMNRLFGDWKTHPFVVRTVSLGGESPLSFAALIEHFEEDVFDIRTGRGRLVFFNPARIPAKGGVGMIALGETLEQAAHLAEVGVPDRLAGLALTP